MKFSTATSVLFTLLYTIQGVPTTNDNVITNIAEQAQAPEFVIKEADEDCEKRPHHWCKIFSKHQGDSTMVGTLTEPKCNGIHKCSFTSEFPRSNTYVQCDTVQITRNPYDPTDISAVDNQLCVQYYECMENNKEETTDGLPTNQYCAKQLECSGHVVCPDKII